MQRWQTFSLFALLELVCTKKLPYPIHYSLLIYPKLILFWSVTDRQTDGRTDKILHPLFPNSFFSTEAGPSSLRNPFLPLFPFFLVPSYVGYVPASDDLGICCFVWRYEFSSKFSFVTEEKSTFCNEALDLPKRFKFWEIPKRFTKTFDSFVLPQYCWVCLIY